MVAIATNEPSSIVAGDHIQWQRTFSDYPASAGWSLAYYLVHPSLAKITINAAPSGDDFLVDVPAATSTAYPAGRRDWQAFVTKGAERFMVDSGTLEIETNFASGSVTTFDDRSHARRVLESIEAVIEARATKDQESYTVEGRSLARTPTADLLRLRNQYRWEVKHEEQAERINNGLDAGNTIHTRFTG